MGKIDIDKFICSLLSDHLEGVKVRNDIHKALQQQGLEYKEGKLVEIETKQQALVEPEYDPYSLPVGDDSNLPTFNEDMFHPCTKKDVEECAKMPEGYIENLRELCKNILKVTEKKEEKK